MATPDSKILGIDNQISKILGIDKLTTPDF